MSIKQDAKLIREQWDRYLYVRERHRDYVRRSTELERMYLGGGEQWSDEDRAVMEASGRMCVEINEIAEPIDNALGRQIQNRANISFRPRGGGADSNQATNLSKLIMQICDNNKFRWLETAVCRDAWIRQRGYYEISLSFDDHLLGEISMKQLDPCDVIPDPDAKTYEPKGWADVIITRWLTELEIAQFWGEATARAVVEAQQFGGESDFGDDLDDGGVERNKFDTQRSWLLDATENGRIPRYRIIDRQYWKRESAEVVVTLLNDIRPAEGISETQRAALLAEGAVFLRRPLNRVRWTVSTSTYLLHDDWSPFDRFSVIPVFGKFIRGKTRGMVDNKVSPQQVLNKSASSVVHMITTTANSGWAVEQGSLANMTIDQLKQWGAQTGLVIEYIKNTQKPEKITANPVPQGMRDVVEWSSGKVRGSTGTNEISSGKAGPQQSSLAIEAMQYAAEMPLIPYLDNLAQSRSLAAELMLEIVQRYYDGPRILRIIETDDAGNETTAELPINQPLPDGGILNDVTMGEYDVVITEVPARATYSQTEFEQILKLVELGVLPPEMLDLAIRRSNLADKDQILKRMEAARSKPNPVEEANTRLVNAQADLAAATATTKNIEGLFSAVNTAQAVVQVPAIAGLADDIAKSAGFIDKDASPIIPQAPPGVAVPPPPVNTNPATPTNPDVGLTTGIETQKF